MKTVEMTAAGGPEVLRFGERAVPEPGSGQLAIEVGYAGLNFTDVLARRGIPGYSTGWPFVPGMEVAGTVSALGDGVDGFAVGDRVLSFTIDGGGLADVAIAEAALSAIVPAGLDLAAAAAIPLSWATALGLVRRSFAGPGESVLITSAAGGVGRAIAVILATRGPGPVVGGVGSTAKGTSLPAGVIPVERGPGFLDRATDAAGGPFDVILESVGGELLGEAMGRLAAGGRLVSYGAAAGQSDPEMPALRELRRTNTAVIGFSILNLGRSNPAATGRLIGEVLALTSGDLAIPPPRIVDWEESIEAHIQQSEGRSEGKQVVRVSAGV